MYSIPKTILRTEIFDKIKNFDGFLSFTIGEPHINKNFNRYGWILFEDEITLQKFILEKKNDFMKIKDITIPLKKSFLNVYNNQILIKLTPPLFKERLDEDIDNTELLIDLLNNLKNRKNII